MPTRRLLAKLREMMASGRASLPKMTQLVAAEMVTEVCSIYVMRPGELLELVATEGLKPEAVGRTRLRVGEGIIGIVAATAVKLNLPDAQNHPGFVYRPETGEDEYASLLAVPVRRAGRTLGVLAVQNRSVRRYGDDEVEVLETVAMLLAEVLATSGGRDDSDQSFVGTVPRMFQATRLAGGIARGQVVMRSAFSAPTKLLTDDPKRELERLRMAVDTMRRGIDDLISTGLPDSHDLDDSPREVLEATRLLAADSGWLKRAAEAVRHGLTAEAAVHRVAGELRDKMRKVVDPYLRERFSDLEDLVQRLLVALGGGSSHEPVPPGSILLVRRLGPAQLLDWQARGIAGVVIEEASPSGHAAILARALGLPAVGGARGALDAAEDGDYAIVDGDEGMLFLRPEVELQQGYDHTIAARAERIAGYEHLRDKPAVTKDGISLRLMINVGLALELGQLALTGADGVGLFRTEIGMLARGAIEDVAQQTANYARVLDAAGEKPVLFRTLDLGGDKLLPDHANEEENPAMGWRSLRIGLDRPALLRRQLRALLLAARGRPLTVMFPMVATAYEFHSARNLLLAEVKRVRPAPAELSIGTMLEVPSLIWQLPALLAEADFVSVGTNDLMQFFFAADRSAPALAGRYDLLSAPALDLLEYIRVQADLAGKPVSVCGEAASRPLEALALVALGYRSLSMPAGNLLPMKSLLADSDIGALRAVLANLRRGAAWDNSLREPLGAWAREQGLDV